MKNYKQFSGNSDYEYNFSDLDAMSYAINYHNNIINKFKPFLGKRILEVGAGSGNLAEILLSNYKEVELLVLLEPDKKTFNKLIERFKNNKKVILLNIFSKDLKEYYSYFDSVIYNNVLEHVENDQNEIINIQKYIKNNGYICDYSPAGKLLFSNFDKKLGHYRRYSKNEKIELFNKAKTKIIILKYSDLIGYFLWLIKFKILNSNGENNYPKQVKFFDNKIQPINEFIEKFINLPFGKNLLVIAQKI